MRDMELINKKRCPIGVKIIAIWFFIQIAILAYFLVEDNICAITKCDKYAYYGSLSMELIFSRTIMIGLLGFLFYTTLRLWKGENWARILIIVVSIFILFFSFSIMIFSGEIMPQEYLIIFLLYIGIIIYLLLPNTRKSFD